MITPGIDVSTRHTFGQGWRIFEIVKTSGGEAHWAIFVWMHEERMMLCGNLFGHVRRAVTNRVAMRVDRSRPVHGDLAEMTGGADALAARTRRHAAADRPLEALHPIDIALGAEPANFNACALKKTCLEQLLVASEGTNLSETMWLRAEIAAVEAVIAPLEPAGTQAA